VVRRERAGRSLETSLWANTIIDHYYNVCSSGTPSGRPRRHGREPALQLSYFFKTKNCPRTSDFALDQRCIRCSMFAACAATAYHERPVLQRTVSGLYCTRPVLIAYAVLTCL
jgi:hypothetical protein